jgi:hypothetical protein
MEKNMTRQIGPLNAFIDAIQAFLNQLAAVPAGTDLCDIVTPEATEALADLLDGLADDILVAFPLGADLPLGFRAQIERLVCIIRLLANRIRAIACPDAEECLAILNEVLCVLVEALAILIGIVIKLIVLDTFLADDDNFFECLVCSLIGEITALEESVKDLSCLIIALISCDIDECTPCFVPTTAGKRPRVNINNNTCSCKKH